MSNKKPEISGLSVASPIVSDTEIEKTISLSEESNYYIGSLKGTSSPYLPVRVSPHEDGLDLGWSDINYDLNEKTVSLGYPINVVEIVESETGTWVGFISDGNILYTDVGYVRIKDGETCPAISKRFLRPQDPLSKVYVPEGSRAVSPKDNQNWLSITPNDVRLTYYNFNEHNNDVVNTSTINDVTIEKYPTLRCSEGYYYFIVGENERQSEAVTSGEIYGQYKTEEQKEQEKLEVSADSIGQLKTSTYEKLLDYLGKKDPGSMLRDKHFVLAGLKVNTQTANPNNQKALFAIRASYADALPDKTFSEIFEAESMAAYSTGKNYAFTVSLRELPKICEDLASKFRNVKSKLEASKLKILDVNEMDYDINIQIEQIENFPKIINGFMARQGWPASTDHTEMYRQATAGTKTQFDNLIQIGIVDNSTLGCGVRETISHVIYSPDPEQLKQLSGNETLINLFDFDPYITEEELSGKAAIKRSGIHLKAALPYLRESFSGAYGSRTLHILLSHSSITKFLNNAGSDMSSYDWAEFLQKYCVPPLKIYPSKDPQQFPDPSELDCDEIIAQLNKSGPNVGRREKILQEKLYNNPKCKEKYFDQFKDATHAGDPSLRKKSLERTNEEIMASIGSGNDREFISVLFQGFFHALDPMALISLLIACLQKKLGISISLEAICRAAIMQLVKSLGPDAVTAIIIANALLTPDRESSRRALAVLSDPNSPYHDSAALQSKNTTAAAEENEQRLILDQRFDGAPIASALIVGEISIENRAIEAIRNLEKGGVTINLVLAPRPENVGTIDVPNEEEDNNTPDWVYAGATHTQEEVDAETKSLLELGYTKRETRALLVQNGYMIPDQQQWRTFADSPRSFKDAGPIIRAASSTTEYLPAEDDQKAINDAKSWLEYMRANIGDIGSLCELLVGDLLDGLEEMLRDPFAQLGTWWEDFMDVLKRAFSMAVPSLRFPDNLSTDSHMGDYGKKLLMMLLSMVALILGQIANLLIKEALDKCLEENNDQGPAPNPALPKRPASLTIPTLSRAGLPKIGGISDADIVKWMKDIIDHLSTGQLCALLRGDASKQTLYDCLARTETKWPEIYAAGIDTIYEIRVAFEKIGKNLDLDICSAITASSPVITDVCEAMYDSDARCEELQKAGLTKEECDAQIQDELNDLKNKLMAMAGLGMFGIDPMTNMMPPACGEGGFFEMPPGVKDSMSRITDNILTTVKGSLIQDMAALEFFAVPPRSVLAMTDPKELEKATKLFTNASNNPYSKMCFAFIGDPWRLENEPPTVGDAPGGCKVYPITYNKFIHYGGMPTWQNNSNAWLEYSITNLPKTNKQANTINKHSVHTAIATGQNSVDFPTHWPSVNEYIEDSKFFEPTHIGNIAARGEASESIMQFYENSRPSMKIALDRIRDDLSIDNLTGPEAEKVAIHITNKFREDVKPTYLKDIVLTKSDLLYLPPNAGYTPLPKPLIGKVFPLYTKLRDVSANPRVWYGALQAFTGCDIPSTGGADLAGALPQKNHLRELQHRTYLFDPYYFTMTEGNYPTIPVRAHPMLQWNLTGSPGKRKRFYWTSPGYVKLFLMYNDLLDAEGGPDGGGHREGVNKVHEKQLVPWNKNVDFDSNHDSDPDDDDYGRQTAVRVFMELTIAEAFGLESHRVSGMFPSFGKIDGVEGILFTFGQTKTLTWQRGQADFEEGASPPRVTRTENNQLIPQYIVFKQYFADPDSPLSYEPDKMVEYFSTNKEKVNPELYNALTNPDNFNQAIGFSTGYTSEDHFGAFAETISQPIRYGHNKHFNSDIIKIDTSFTELTARSVSGFSGQEMATKVINTINQNAGSQNSQMQSILQNFEFINKKESLIYQNVILPLEDNVTTQLHDIKNTYKFIKGKVAQYENNKIIGPGTRTKSKYDFNFGKKLDKPTQELIQDLFGAHSAQNILDKSINAPGLTQNNNVLNFKNQIFSELLLRRFIAMFNSYKPSGTSLPAGFASSFRNKLALHSFPALQQAYVHQTFAKLKDSRLHERGMMRKIWKKILKNPLNTGPQPDPNCLKAFSASSRDDLDKTETDFFNLDDVKRRITSFYEKSVCQDVYEKSSPEDNAARLALLQGCVILLVKVYTLEMCLASIIAWDSYGLSDIIKNEMLVKIIVSNIKEDIDIDMIAYICNDILRKEEGLSDIEAAYFRGDQSGLEYLIKAESEHIIKTVENIFSNSNPMTTDLNLEVLKSSNIDSDSVRRKLSLGTTAHAAGIREYAVSASMYTNKIKSFHKQSGVDHVLDVRFGSNIYTMNYENGYKTNTIFNHGQHSTLSMKFLTSPALFDNKSSLSSEYKSSQNIIAKNNRNFFHSLPMTHRSRIPAGVFSGHEPVNVGADEYEAMASVEDAIPGIYANGDTLLTYFGFDVPAENFDSDLSLLFHGYANEPFFNTDADEWTEFYNLNMVRGALPHSLTYTAMDDVAVATINANAFLGENLIENTMGNNLNRKLGNVIIQPYVKINDIPEDENPGYWDNMSVDVLQAIAGSDTTSDGEPCAPDYMKTTINASEYTDIFNSINNKRNEDSNVFKSYMFGYIPISAWSHFYNTIFLKTIFSYESAEYNFNPLYELYKKYGFKLIFKKFKIGLRLTYTIPAETFDQVNYSNDPIKIKDIMEDTFTGEDNIKGLKACKSLYVQRPYFTSDDVLHANVDAVVLAELHIPIVELEKELVIKEGLAGFTIDNNEKLYNLDELGFWSEGIDVIVDSATGGWTLDVLANQDEGALKYIVNTPYSFFYKNLAEDLVKDLKSSPEFKLLYDYALPQDNYMALGFLYAADGLSRYIPEPTDVLDETKKKILMIMENLMNSQDFSFVPADVLSALGDMGLRNMGGTRGQEPDMTKLILKIIYRTLFLILKGFVEITDPAIIIAKIVIDIANAVIMGTLSIAKQILSMAKMILDGSKMMAESALQNALMQVQISATMVNSAAKATPMGTVDDDPPGYINIDVEGEDPAEMTIEIVGVDGETGAIDPNSDFATDYNNLDSQDQKNVDKVIEGFLQIKELFELFVEAKQTLDEINAKLNGAIADLQAFQQDAEKTMKEIFNSPYLLPGLWAAMLPSMIPFGGGIIPPPFFAGPPSTIPGMIYLALLLIDAIEDKQHNDASGEDTDCEDEL